MGGCARPIRGARVNRLRSNATKRPIRGRELIKVRDLFKEIRYVIIIYLFLFIFIYLFIYLFILFTCFAYRLVCIQLHIKHDILHCVCMYYYYYYY